MLPQVVTYLPGLRPLSTMELYTDIYYIQRIQAGDVACFACLLDKYSRPIHSLILKVVRSQEEAEELAQDTFMKVFKKPRLIQRGLQFLHMDLPDRLQHGDLVGPEEEI